MDRKTRVLGDLAVVLVGAAAALAAAFYFDAFEEYARWAQKYERWQVDEFVAVPVVLALVLGFFYWSRWRALKGEVAERERAEEATVAPPIDCAVIGAVSSRQRSCLRGRRARPKFPRPAWP